MFGSQDACMDYCKTFLIEYHQDYDANSVYKLDNKCLKLRLLPVGAYITVQPVLVPSCGF